ncbi:MAG: 2-oxoglutarate dehydrogenase E1 component, partial [Paracoccaceae bacterium]
MTDQSSNDAFHSSSFLQGHNAEYVEQLYARYAENPASVDESWRRYFAQMNEDVADARRAVAGPSWARADWPPQQGGDRVSTLTGEWDDPSPVKLEAKIAEKAETSGAAMSAVDIRHAVLDSIRAIMLIRAFRIRGHLAADLDPLRLTPPVPHPELDPRTYGFTEADMDRPIFIDNVLGLETASLREIVGLLQRTYCGTFALQFMHISNAEEAGWLKERIEGFGKEIKFTQEGRRAILNKLVEAEGFEKFLHVKYTGTKRFGLDGAESLIPAMEQMIKRGGALGVEDVVFGMPHRGRLNVLASVLAKPFRAIFHEFRGGSYKPDEVEGSGDVKYHLGASSDREFDGNKVHLSLTANPSHLEAVNPVVLGKVRAKQAQIGDTERRRVLPILLHGDAAFAGQGVVAECFGLSGLKGHRTGGTIHIVVNNQIGFTTAPHNSRSSPYPTDIALMVEAPIFHVNGDDPEAVVHAARVATEYRQKFGKDVVLDIFCYRRFGHNEGDEPMFTQPGMYKEIKTHKTTLQLYTERLVKDGLIPEGEIEDAKTRFQAYLNEEFETAKDFRPNKADWLDGRWAGMGPGAAEYQRGATAASPEDLEAVGTAITSLPDSFKPHRTIERLMETKREMITTGEGIDWATAEALAFGTLQLEGYPVRLSGQDCTRGTFSQRHSGLTDQETEERYFPLNHIRAGQAQYEVVDSMLSEYAVLGYEYGYSLAEPNALTLWEAQFGDFANGAQIMIDQFISSGERKWLRMSGLVMLLP